MKTTIIYWTSTGNTEKMAKLIEKGLNESIDHTKDSILLKAVSDCDKTDVESSDMVILGCSAMGVEEIDTSEMEPYLHANKDLFKAKPIALFGSYGWGDGEWMQDWEALMESFGASLEADSLIVEEAPEAETADACIKFGNRLGKIR